MDGILIIDKPVGHTSNDVVQEVKRLLKARKVGHLGTLDPLASGVLPLVINKTTKYSSRFSKGYKIYEFDLILGAATSTDDEEGIIVQKGFVPDNAFNLLRGILPSFLGEISQIPPAYSAIKVRGVALYKRARQGEFIDVIPRKVRVFSLIILKANTLKRASKFRLRMVCSSGTYVRALCRDIGEGLGFFGHAGKIRRIASGPFNISEAITLDELKKMTPLKRQKLVF